MLLTEDQSDERTLLRFGAEAAALLVNRDFCALADRFGYALAYDRKASDAIEADLASCLAQSDQALDQVAPWQVVKYFKPNDANLFAVVESVACVPEGPSVLLELIVSEGGTDVPRGLSSAAFWSPITQPKEIGHEEVICQRADHRTS